MLLNTPGSFDTVQLLKKKKNLWICKIAFFQHVFIGRHGVFNAVMLYTPFKLWKKIIHVSAHYTDNDLSFWV